MARRNQLLAVRNDEYAKKFLFLTTFPLAILLR